MWKKKNGTSLSEGDEHLIKIGRDKSLIEQEINII